MFSILAQQFEQSIQSYGGSIVEDCRQDGLMCAILPIQAEIRKGDSISSGIALIQEEEGPALHGFALRVLCTNGMLAPEIEEARQTSISHLPADLEEMLPRLKAKRPEQLARLFRQSLRLRLTHPQLEYAIERIAAILRESNKKLYVSMPAYQRRRHVRRIRRRLEALMERERAREIPYSDTNREHSLFDLSNAVTDMAHDVEAPAAKWRLMQLGRQLLTAKGASEAPRLELQTAQVAQGRTASASS